MPCSASPDCTTSSSPDRRAVPHSDPSSFERPVDHYGTSLRAVWRPSKALWIVRISGTQPEWRRTDALLPTGSEALVESGGVRCARGPPLRSVLVPVDAGRTAYITTPSEGPGQTVRRPAPSCVNTRRLITRWCCGVSPSHGDLLILPSRLNSLTDRGPWDELVPRTATEVSARLVRGLGLGRRVVPHELATSTNSIMGRNLS